MKPLSEKEVMKYFNRFKRKYIKALGRKPTTGVQLFNLCKELFGDKFIGVYSQDSKIPTTKNKTEYYILNQDTAKGKGIHWIGLVNSKNNIWYIWDSYGRKSKKLLPLFTKGKGIVVDADYDVDQSKTSTVCGPICIAWLSTVETLGIRNALKV